MIGKPIAHIMVAVAVGMAGSAVAADNPSSQTLDANVQTATDHAVVAAEPAGCETSLGNSRNSEPDARDIRKSEHIARMKRRIRWMKGH